MKVEGKSKVAGFKGSRVQKLQSSDPSTLQPFNPFTHRLALMTAYATFLLLLVGGLVTSKGAGLAVPDWPTTFGYNMFFYPWAKMVGNVFYEHAHRLVASGVGLLTLTLALFLWICEPQKWLRILGAVALALVIVQGVIGGLRVVLLEETLAILHACFAQAFFALTVSLVLFTSPEWKQEPRKIAAPDAGAVARLCTFTTALIFVQGISGAVVRHTGTRLDLHLLLAALVALHVVLLVTRIARLHSGQPELLRPALLLVGLLVGQLALGLASYLGKFTSFAALPAPAVVTLTTGHVVTGALMLATSLILTLKSYRSLTQPDTVPNRRSFSQVVMP
jgi:cytochrome c oxidase assembly protein subunit 15